jgi:hypothetical protein
MGAGSCLIEAMPFSTARLKRHTPTWADYYSGQVLLWGLVLIGPAFVFRGFYADHRDRPSLQWPKVPGVIMQCEEIYHPSARHSHYTVAVSYIYVVNGRRYLGNRITLWNPDLAGGSLRTQAFVTAHPVRSSSDVYCDPQHPENAVLIPGSDEEGNRTSIWCGSISFVAAVLLAFQMRKHLASMKATLQSPRTHRSAKADGLPQGFVSYEPDRKRKLNAFPDKECLLEVLGHHGKPLQEWKPEDRVIDVTGREYRLVKPPGKNCYDLDPTGETWSYERLLDAAQADARLLKKDPEALRRQLNDVAADKRLSVLI